MTSITDPIYRRLPGRSLNPLTASTLYAAPDHLLMISSPGYLHEHYIRFYFRDIQALLLQKTRRRAVVNMVVGVPAAMCLLGILSVSSAIWMGVLVTLASLLLGVVALNTLRGPTSICRVVTAYSDRVLPSLGRLRTAERVTALLEPSLRKAQEGLAEASGGARPVGTPGAFRRIISPRRAASRGFHRLTLAVLFLYALLLVLGLFVYGEVHSLATGVVFTALYPLVMLALVRQQNSLLAPGLQRWTWAVFWFMVISYSMNYVYSLTGYFRYAAHPDGQWGVMRQMLAEGPYDNPFVYGLLLGNLAVTTALLTASLLIYLRGTRGNRDGTPAATADAAQP